MILALIARRRIVSNRMVLRVAKLRRAGLVARNCGLGPEAAADVRAGSYCSLFVRTSLGTAELKSIPTNQTRVGQKKDFR